MSRTLLLLLLLLHRLAAARPPAAATPRLKLSFPGEHGTRAGRGVGSALGALVPCQHRRHHQRDGRILGGSTVRWVQAPAVAHPQSCCRPPRRLSGVGTVPYLMPAPPGPPACPWGHACAWDLAPSPRHVQAQVPHPCVHHGGTPWPQLCHTCWERCASWRAAAMSRLATPGAPARRRGLCPAAGLSKSSPPSLTKGCLFPPRWD